MEPAKELLFVYGTLRRGASRGGYAARLEAEAEWLGAAQTPGRLYQVNPDYPGMVKTDNPKVGDGNFRIRHGKLRIVLRCFNKILNCF